MSARSAASMALRGGLGVFASQSLALILVA